MPLLVWNEADFAACLEVLPEIEAEGIEFVYRVVRHGMRLELSIFPYASDICIDLFREGIETPVFQMKMIACGGTRYVNDDRGEYLEFAPAKVFGNRYDGISSIPHGVRLSVRPSLSIRLFCA